MFQHKQIEKLQRDVKNLQWLVSDLISLLGFCGYGKGNWVSKNNPEDYRPIDFISANHNDQPITQKEFQALLDCLNLNVQLETSTFKITKKKIKK